jgi:hypothetical protein
VIKETEKGKFVENKKAGLIMKVPEGWKVTKMGAEEDLEEGAIVLYSSNSEIELRKEKKTLPLEKGCLIFAKIIYKELSFGEIKIEARYNHSILGLKSEEFEEITVHNYPALKIIFDTQATGPGLDIYIPIDTKVYLFTLFWELNKKESCIQSFDEFLKTVIIK